MKVIKILISTLASLLFASQVFAEPQDREQDYLNWRGARIMLAMPLSNPKHHGIVGTGKRFPIYNENAARSKTTFKPSEIDVPQYKMVDRLVDLPICSASKTERVEVPYLSMGSESLDYLFYSFTDSSQRERGEKWQGLSVPYYVPKNKEKAEDSEVTFLQHFALQLGVNCLPTRVYFSTTESGASYLNYSMGEKAWER